MFRSGSTSRGLSLVGMDIGRRGVRVVQLMGMGRHAAGTDAGRQWRLCRAFCWDGSSGSRDGSVDPAPAGGVIDLLRSPGGCSELGGRLRRILRQNEFRGRNLAVGISSPAIETHALELPIQGDKSGDSSLQQAAHWEIERLMRFGQGEAESDFWLLPAGETKLRRGGALPPGQPTAIGVAVEKTVVSGVWSACTSAGMVCQRLDAGLCALSRFGSWLRSLPVVGASLSEPSAAEVWGLLDLGAAQVRLVLCVGDVPVLVRCFDTGGERWVTRLSETLGLSPAAAEIHLRDHGISTKGSGRSTTEEPGRGVRGG
ncbi:MAG: hypothetical protein GY842_10290, partial [bacterium]|nr:hypothetical protein [bacterium]